MTETERLLVLGFGAIVTGIGLALQFLRRDAGSSRLKVFGQEFEIATPALVVFLAGCGVFVLPFFVPVRRAETLTNSENPAASAVTSRLGNAPAEPGLPSSISGIGSSTAPLTADAGQPATEIEPNDGILQPNVLPFGLTVRAEINPVEDKDFYQIQTVATGRSEVRVVIRNRSALQPEVVVRDASFVEVISDYSVGGDLYLTFMAEPSSDYFVEVRFIPVNRPERSQDSGGYDLTVLSEAI